MGRKPSPVVAGNAAPELHIMNGVFFNAAGTAFEGTLVHFGAAGFGSLRLDFDDENPHTGIRHKGVELRFARDPHLPNLLYGKIGDTDANAFVITARENGSYAFKQIACFDAARLRPGLRLGRDAKGYRYEFVKLLNEYKKI